MSLGRAGLQCQRVQRGVRALQDAFQRLVDQALLLHPVLAAELLGHHGGGKMVVIAGQVPDLDRCAGQGVADQALGLLTEPLPWL